MQDQTVKQETNPREKIVKKLKATYKLKDGTAEDLQRKRVEFLAGFEALGDWYAAEQEHSANLGNNEIENPETNEENKLIANRHLLKAVALYNMAIASEFYVPRKDEDNKSQKVISSEQSLSVNQQRFIQKMQSIEDQMVRSAKAEADSPAPATKLTLETYWQKNQEAKNKLQIIRGQAREALDKISRRNSDDETIEIIEAELPNVQQIYHDIATGQQQLVRELLDDCLNQLPPPEGCIYSIIVLGSLAREEATPYSDFEWAILFEDQGEERNAQYKTYFRRLAELLWIKVLNLRETTSRMMDIEGINGKDEEIYGPIPKGFSFDGQMADGCHTPLGNRHHKVIQHKYELIGTPHELAQFQQNTWEHKRGLSTVLSTVAVIQSNDVGLEHPLIEQYESEMEQIWNTPEEHTDQRTREVTHQTLIQRRSLKFLAESSESFQFRGGKFDKEAHYFDAKYHLYRLPNMLIDHLASYFGITKEKNLWDRIEAIWGEQSIASNPDAVTHLKRTISTILIIRSMAYLQKGHRDDHVLMFDPSHPEKNQHLLQTYLGINQTLLFEIFYVLIPLQFRMAEFVETEGTITTLIEDSYYDSSAFRQAWIYALLLDYVTAAKLYKKAKRIMIATHGEQYISVADTLNNLGLVYRTQARYEEAITAHEKAKDIYIATHGKQHVSVANTWNNLGNVYEAQSHYQEAIVAYEAAKDIYITTLGEQHISVAEVLNNLGLAYADQSRYLDATAAYEKTLSIKIATYGEQHVSLAETLGNLGNVYSDQSRYLDAIAAHEKAKDIYIAAYGEQHIDVAGTLNNLGNVYSDQGRYAEAIVAYETAQDIYITTHGDQHINVADTLNNLGLVYQRLDNYSEAIAVYETAKRIYIATHDEQHIDVANTLNNLGIVYEKQNRYTEAIVAYEKAIDIYIATHGEQHASVVDTLINLGAVYPAQGHYMKAIVALKAAERTMIAIHGEQHIDVADVLNNLGIVYRDQGRYAEAIAAFEKAKCIYITILGEQHGSVANTLNNLGNIYSDQGRYLEARAAYETAKRIKIVTYGAQHTSMADTVNNLGNIFVEQKRFEEARQFFRQAMSVYKQFKHPDKRMAKMNFALSYLREGNVSLLQKEMNVEKALRCYQLFNQQNADLNILEQSAGPRDPQSHQQLANLFYQRNDLLPTIEHYQILLRLAPDNVSAHHNLACMLHIRAQIEKDKGDDEQYKAYLEEVKSHFEKAIQLESNTCVCTEYALFMWKNKVYFQSETITEMLQRAITLGQLERGLSYGMMERPTVAEQLQTLIDEENTISFKAVYLAYYLLVQIHCEAHQLELANGDMSLLAAHVIEFNAKIEIQLDEVSDQINALMPEGEPEELKIILSEQQEEISDLKKQKRLANKLVELSQATIEAKQKEIAALSVHTNIEVKQQQIEIKEVMDSKSQISFPPLTERTTSPAQLISQFSSVIRLQIDENPNVSQQAQISEQIADADRVERITDAADAEHDNAKKLTQ